MILVHARVQGQNGVDTSGAFVFDSGAGYLAIDDSLALSLDLVDSLPRREVSVSRRALPRLLIGRATMDQLSPVLVFDADLLARVTEQAVLGLIGYEVVRDRVVGIDYAAERMTLLPGGVDRELENTPAVAESRRMVGRLISPSAVPVRFRLTDDGKALIHARVEPMRGGRMTPWLTLVLDTGASKCVLFDDLLAELSKTSGWEPALKGLLAPTLFGTSQARLALAKRIQVKGASGMAEAKEVEVALLANPLAAQLQRDAGEPVHGLLGYSMLQRFRLAFDYPRRVLWLDPIPGFPHGRPSRLGHVGLQFERVGTRMLVVAVAEDSPAARADIHPGDEIVEVDGRTTESAGTTELRALLDGAPGTHVSLVVRRGATRIPVRLERKRLYE